MIAIVDYGAGNISSVKKALEHVAPEAQIQVTNDPKVIAEADKLVMPGVGHSDGGSVVNGAVTEDHTVGLV